MLLRGWKNDAKDKIAIITADVLSAENIFFLFLSVDVYRKITVKNNIEAAP